MRAIERKDVELLASVRESFPDAWNEEMLSSAFDGGRFFGFIEEREEGFSFVTFSLSIDTADIEDVFTSESLRRQGIAKALLLRALTFIKEKGKGRVLLEVNEKNAPAIALYSSLGFRRIAVRKKYYSSGDALVLEKEL